MNECPFCTAEEVIVIKKYENKKLYKCKRCNQWWEESLK
jgi:transposase-like protein